MQKALKSDCSRLGSAPFFLLVCFASLATKRKSGWGICGSSCCVVFCFVFVIELPLLVLANCALYLFSHRLCFYQDRATEHLRPKSRDKKRVAAGRDDLAEIGPTLDVGSYYAFGCGQLLCAQGRRQPLGEAGMCMGSRLLPHLKVLLVQ